MINKIHLGKRISLLRKNLGLSQAELAEKLGITSQAVSKWECGNAIPDIDLLLELSHIYCISFTIFSHTLFSVRFPIISGVFEGIFLCRILFIVPRVAKSVAITAKK